MEAKTKTKELKLFVWVEFCPDYYNGLAFAIAEDEQEAKELILKKYNIKWLSSKDFGPLKIHELDSKTSYSVRGSS